MADSIDNVIRPHVSIWTDGGCDPNPGYGAWAAVLTFEGHKRELTGTETDTTNNRMELMGVIGALEALKKPCDVTIHTDSQWVIKCGTREWKRQANLDLWSRYDYAHLSHEIEFKWVRGHNGEPMNERCHTLVEQALRQREVA